MRQCSRCKRHEPEVAFYASRSTCKGCTAEWGARYRSQNKERIAKSNADYRSKNAERRREANAAWRAENPGYMAKKTAEWYQANPDWRREWRAANPEKVARYQRTRRARKSGAKVVEPVDLLRVYERDQGVCHICKRHVDRIDASIDHLVPLSVGGDHSYANVSLAHLRCNQRRGVGRIPAQLRLIG